MNTSRDLADLISMTVHAGGNANAVWTDDAGRSPNAIMSAKADRREAFALSRRILAAPQWKGGEV